MRATLGSQIGQFLKRRQAEQALATLSHKLLQTQEAERRHLARELHDVIGQALTALKIGLHTAGQAGPGDLATLLEDAQGQLDQMARQVRDLSLDLRPPMIDDLGLEAALRWHCKGLAERAGLPCRLEVGSLPQRPPAEVEMACFRVVQEALTNVAKHAQARQATIELRQEDQKLCLVVLDDGIGFDVAVARGNAVQGTSLGLLSMEERVLLLGGRFGIQSAPKGGTEIRARFPLVLGPAPTLQGDPR